MQTSKQTCHYKLVNLQTSMESGTIDPMKIEAEAFLPTEYGNFKIRVMVDENGSEHSILSVGLEQTDRVPLVRIHSECLTAVSYTHLRAHETR